MTKVRLATLLATCALLAGCGESQALEDSEGPVVDVSNCITAELGPAYSSKLDGPNYSLQTRLWLGKLEVGVMLSMSSVKTGTFKIDTPVNRDFRTCTECVIATDFLDDGSTRRFVARYGRIRVDQAPATDDSPSSGSFSSLVFYESTIDFEAGIATRVDGGEGLFLPSGGWNTAECLPGSSCGPGLECVPTFYSTRGSCNPVGINAAGQPCSERVAGTDCEAGSSCSEGECGSLCDYWSSGACPEGQVCGPTGLCTSRNLDEAMVGEACVNEAGWWCGNDGTRYGGYCRTTGLGSRCQALCRVGVASDCAETQVCEPFEDQEYGTCIPG